MCQGKPSVRILHADQTHNLKSFKLNLFSLYQMVVFLGKLSINFKALFLPAMDHSGTRTRSPIDIVTDGSNKLYERLCALWDSMIGPHCVVKLPNEADETQLLLLNTQKHHIIVWPHSVTENENVVPAGGTYTADSELSDCPLWKNRLWQHLDYEISVVQRILIKRPVVITLHLDVGIGEKT